MKKLVLVITGCIFALSGLGQTLDWAKSFGGTSFDIGYAITVDASGNIYTTGVFDGTVDLDPGPGVDSHTSAWNDCFVQKLDAAGNLLWAKSFGGTNDDDGQSINVDASGNVYVTGSFENTVDFDPGAGTFNLTSEGSNDIFILKLDASGNFLWAKSFGGTGIDLGWSSTVDATGNVYTTGSYSNTTDFDPGAGTFPLTSAGGTDIFVQKLDASGNFVWAKSFGGANADEARAINVDASGNVYTTGHFQGTGDFDPSAGTTNLTSVGGYDVFVQKLDASGNFLWAKSSGGGADDFGYANTVDASGNVHSTGVFRSIVDFDPGTGTLNLTSSGVTDIFIQKLDASGNLVWANSFGGIDIDQGKAIAVDGSGNVYTSGNFRSTVDFDPGTGTLSIASLGGFDGFVQKLDASGNFVYAISFGGTGSDSGNSLYIDGSGNVHTTGNFNSTVDFDPGSGAANLTSFGANDVFIQKLSECPSSYGTDIITACDSYTWIDGNTYTASNNSATHTLTNAAGCDSIVTLDLTINSVSDITSSLSGLTITATNSNATYQWLDCDNNYGVINGETNQTFTASVNGNYAIELTENGCVDTSNCVAITTVGIIENYFGTDLLIYPNPTTGDFSIDLSAYNGQAQLIITDMHGKVIQSQTVIQGQILNIAIENPAGMYFVSIQDEDKKAVVRLVKE
jgi:hypothetical protein